ncbi:MAG TPA: DUF5666 domain-containing protein [Burkholderiaceae bacterium]|nr:DUF5666 domain-containing protein [Burkholderiaceae bacterium]
MRLFAALGALVLAVLLASCGGSVGSGGTGAPVARATAQGTVTGFGSVIVDDVVYEDDGVTSRVEVAPGRYADRPVLLAQRVELDYEQLDGRLVLRSLTVAPSIVGPVEAVAPGAFTVLGQTVQVNDDPEDGPPTLYEGIGSLATLKAGDWVEVHGLSWRSGALYHWRATRVEKLASAGTARIAAVVTQVGPGSRLQLGALAVAYEGAAVLPAGHAVRQGNRVVVWGQAEPGGMRATGIRVDVPPTTPRPADGPADRAAGVVGALDAAVRRFDLGGLPVDYGGASVTPAGETVAEGRYVQIEGRWGPDGVFVARQLKIRKKDQPNDRRERVVLRGLVESYQSPALFRVRGTQVDASGAELRRCDAGLADGVEVRVQGWREAGTPVRADTVECRR